MDRIARYGALKTRSREMSGYIDSLRDPKNRPDIERLHADLTHCADYLVFHDYYTVDQLRLAKAHTCKKHLLCPFCAARRASKAVEKNLPKVQAAIVAKPSLKPVMITFTIKNGEDLLERFTHLKQSLKRLQIKRRDCLKGQKWTEFAKVQGGIFSYEVTNKDAGWHPHVHMVALIDDWIDQAALSREWQEITGDSFIVGVSRIKAKAQDLQVGGLDIASGLLEVFKYALKFQDLSLPDTWHAFNVLRGRRLIDSFGSLRGIEMPESLLDEPLDNLPYLELIYRYSSSKRAYDLTRTTRHLPVIEPDKLPDPDATPTPYALKYVHQDSQPLCAGCGGDDVEEQPHPAKQGLGCVTDTS